MKHVLTIQDLTCVGECSIKAALPILSVLGHETSVLPVSVLSSHTAFHNVSISALDSELDNILDSLKKENIQFDCILSGYLSNEYQLKVTRRVVDEFLKEDGLYILDPAMADHGKLYRGFDMSFVSAMKELVKKADIILPNVSEACLLTDTPYKEFNEEEQRKLAESLNEKYGSVVIMTGAIFKDGNTGALVNDKSGVYSYKHAKSVGSYFGTGDIFAAVFTGTYLSNNDLSASVKRACDFVKRSIDVTDKDHWYGVQFEKILGELYTFK